MATELDSGITPADAIRRSQKGRNMTANFIAEAIDPKASDRETNAALLMGVIAMLTVQVDMLEVLVKELTKETR